MPASRDQFESLPLLQRAGNHLISFKIETTCKCQQAKLISSLFQIVGHTIAMAPPVLIGSQLAWKAFVRGMIYCTSVDPTKINDLQKELLKI
jgi:hypothetical protein